jgi:ubiquinone/menaquinone biosynthesis C-methylase UbiE
MLIGAARRLSSGRAVGVDLWRTEDLSGNRPEATLANAVAEGVAERVTVETADMRQLPFPDHSFDRVVSCAAIHNLADADGRAQAIREIARVLRPGGFAIIDDIRHFQHYLATFRSADCVPIRRLDSPVIALFWTILTCGLLRPGAWLVQRPDNAAV